MRGCKKDSLRNRCWRHQAARRPHVAFGSGGFVDFISPSQARQSSTKPRHVGSVQSTGSRFHITELPGSPPLCIQATRGCGRKGLRCNGRNHRALAGLCGNPTLAGAWCCLRGVRLEVVPLLFTRRGQGFFGDDPEPFLPDAQCRRGLWHKKP